MTYEHPRLGISIELADGWEVASEVPPDYPRGFLPGVLADLIDLGPRPTESCACRRHAGDRAGGRRAGAGGARRGAA